LKQGPLQRSELRIELAAAPVPARV
jgi:hypothetical protein